MLAYGTLHCASSIGSAYELSRTETVHMSPSICHLTLLGSYHFEMAPLLTRMGFNGAHGVVFSQDRTAPSNIFTQTVKISQKPYRNGEKCTFEGIEYLLVSGLDVLYLLCLVPRTADSQGPK